MTNSQELRPQVASTIGLPCLLHHHHGNFSATSRVLLGLDTAISLVLTTAGWLTCAGWQAAIATAAFFTGTLIQGLIVENHSDYSFQRWHGTLLTWAAVLLAVIFNTVLSPALPKVEGMVLVLHILGFFAILIPLVYLAPHSAPSEVFTVFLNSGGWRSQGLSFFIGLIGNATAFLGKL